MKYLGFRLPGQARQLLVETTVGRFSLVAALGLPIAFGVGWRNGRSGGVAMFDLLVFAFGVAWARRTRNKVG